MSLTSQPAPGLPTSLSLGAEDGRLRFEILLLKLTMAVAPVTLVCWLLMPSRAPGLALGSQLILPAYAALAAGAALRRPRLLTEPWFQALLWALQLSLTVLQVWAYDKPTSPLWLAFLPGLLVGAARWEFRGAVAALSVFSVDRIVSLKTLAGLSAPSAASQLILELMVMTILAVTFGFLFRELERYRQRLRASTESVAASTDVLAAVLENVGEAILTVDDAGRVSSANWAASELFACAAEALVATPIDQLLSGDGMDLAGLLEQVGRSRSSEAAGRRRDQTSFTAEVVTTLIVGDGGAIRILVLRDVTELRARTAALSHRALHDGLTGLPNRVQLTELLLERLAVARRNRSPFGLLLMDLDDFKRVNDTRGHHVGDQLLRAVAERLKSQLRETDVVARLGGDEFAILPGATTAPADSARIAEKIVAAFREPFSLEDSALDSGVSIGIAFFPEHGEDAEALMRQADSAMYEAKRSRRGWTVAATRPASRDAAAPVSLADLRRAVEDGELGLRCTPVMSLRDRRLCGVEAQPRWNHPELGPLDADSFMARAEADPLIRPLTGHLARLVVEQQARWRDGGSEVCASFRVSSRNLGDPRLLSVIAELLHEHHLPAAGLTLLVDEAAALLAGAAAFFEAARGYGLRLGIDDFGAGPLVQLPLLGAPFTEIRLASDLTALATSASDAGIVRSIIDLAHSQGMRVCATGVADQPTLDRLRELDCDDVTFLRWGQLLTPEVFDVAVNPDTLQAVLTGHRQPTTGPNPAAASASG